jgi:hypothetical protein
MGFFFFLGLGFQFCKNLRNFWKFFKKKKGPVSTIGSIMPIIWNFFLPYICFEPNLAKLLYG